MKKTFIIGSILFALPMLVLAGGPPVATDGPSLSYFGNFIAVAESFIERLIPVLIGIGVLVFFWGLIQYIRKPEGAEGRKIMIAGLVALFIMVSVWGIIKLAQGILQVEDGTAGVKTPGIPPQAF